MTKWKWFWTAIADELCVLFFINRSDGKNTKKTNHKDCQASDENAEGPHRSITPLTNSNPRLASNEKSNGKKLIIERVKQWAELVGIVAALIGGFFLYGQMKANLRQAIAAEKQFAEMQRENRLDERAWIGASTISSVFNVRETGQEPFSVECSVPYSNTGKTPAINVVAVAGDYLSLGDIPDYDEYPPIIYASVTCPPAATFKAEIDNSPTIASNRYKWVKAGNPVFIAGTVTPTSLQSIIGFSFALESTRILVGTQPPPTMIVRTMVAMTAWPSMHTRTQNFGHISRIRRTKPQIRC